MIGGLPEDEVSSSDDIMKQLSKKKEQVRQLKKQRQEIAKKKELESKEEKG